MKKSEAKHHWLKRGLNPDDFEKAWTAYSKSTRCEWCKNEYKSERDKQMDHCHQEDDYYKKGDFRNILCQTCNGWRRNCTNIYKTWCKIENIYYYRVQVSRNRKIILTNKRRTLEKAQELLLEFKTNNGFYFPFFNSD